MKRGEHVLVKIEGLTPKGDGVGAINGKEVVVPRTVPGDQAVTFIKRKRKGRLEGEADAFYSYGLPRQPPGCRHFGFCGGCRWQDIAYKDQLVLKEELVHMALARHGVPAAEEALPIAPSPTALFYRNKMEYSFGREQDGQLRLGLHLRGRYDRIFDVEECLLQSDLSNRIVQVVRANAIALDIPPYDLKEHRGNLRFLVIREGKNSGERLVNLVVAQYPDKAVDALVDRVLADVPEIDAFVVTLHQGKAQVAMGEREFVLKGSGMIIEKCGGVEYGISPRSFFQTNPRQAENMLRLVASWAGLRETDTVLDLYCGTGSFSLFFARSVRRVFGVEAVQEAIVDARRNARRNNIENCQFLVGAVEEVLDGLLERCQGVDLVIVDPPRAGIHKKALDALSRLKPPAIIYVSCNPQTLAANLAEMISAGYRLKKLQPVDMFPQTPHCEVVALLTVI